MKRFLTILGLLALLVGGVAVLRARRAAACDRELARLISGPLLPGSEAVRNQWMFGIHSEEDLPIDCVVQGESVLEPGSEPGADVIRRIYIGSDRENGTNPIYWTIRSGTPTEQRFFDFLRDACETGILVLNEKNGVRSSRNRAFVQDFPSGALPEKTRGKYATYSPEMDERSRRELRERVGAFFEREAARDGVVLREEAAMPFSLFFAIGQFEEPGIVRRAVAWTCDRLSLSFLESVREWANGADVLVDPLQRLNGRTVLFFHGAPQTGVRYMPDKNWSEPIVFIDPPETVVPIVFGISDETPLAAAIRNLCETRKPWTLGESVPSLTPGEAFHLGRPVLIGQDGTNKWTVVLDRTSPRFRSFMLDLLRLLADPPPASQTNR